MQIRYNGFTYENPNLTLTDRQLIEENIMTHLYTRKNTRFYMPEYGGDIESYVFEMDDDDLINSFNSMLKDILNFDPRVKIISGPTSVLSPDENILACSVTLQYVDLSITDKMILNMQLN